MQEAYRDLPVTSSREPNWAPEARECYRGVIGALQRAEVPFAVSGGFALHRHTGIWRATKDLDLVLPPAAIPQATQVLKSEGFETNVQDAVWLAKAWRQEYFVDLITGVGNATLAVEKCWIDRALSDEVLGIPCKVLRADELIASKLFVTRRERFDGADIAHLIKSCGRRLDWDWLLQLVEPHWEMLYWELVLFAYIYPAHVDLVPASLWASFAERFKERVTRPEKDAPFRGTLVDPKMFAIDVDEWGERDLYRERCESYPCLIEAEKSFGSLE